MAQRYLSLQWLRALAAWMVVFHHYMQLFRDFQPQSLIGKFFTYHGSLGVDIFFVLSGFIMAYSIKRRQPAASGFIWDRLTRIVPAYWLATLILILVLQTAQWESIAYLKVSGIRELLYSLFFIPHEHASGLGIFPVLTVGWTLNFEMFFYVLLGFALLANKRWAVEIGIALVVLLPLISYYIVPLGFVASDFLLYEFALGLGVYLLLQVSGGFWARHPALQLGLAGCFMVVAALALLLETRVGNMVLAVSLVAGFVLAESVFARLSQGLGRIFVHLGNLSYSTYLLHIPALILIGGWLDISAGNDLTLIPAVVALTYVMSWVSYIYIEGRLRNWSKHRLRSRPR